MQHAFLALLAAWINGGLSTRSSTPARSSMSRSGVEVVYVELVGGTDLGRGRGKPIERESRRGHAVQVGGAAQREQGRRGRGRGSSRSKGAQRAECVGDAHRDNVGEAQSERAIYTALP